MPPSPTSLHNSLVSLWHSALWSVCASPEAQSDSIQQQPLWWADDLSWDFPSPGFVMALVSVYRAPERLSAARWSRLNRLLSPAAWCDLFFSFILSSSFSLFLQVHGKMTTQSLNYLYRISTPACMAPLLQAPSSSLRIDRGQDWKPLLPLFNFVPKHFFE